MLVLEIFYHDQFVNTPVYLYHEVQYISGLLLQVHVL